MVNNSISRRHQSAMAVLVKRWHVRFCKQAYRYSKDAAIAKDIAQDAWITILSKIDCLEKPEKFGSWGLSIVTKKSIDWYRKSKRNIEGKQELGRGDFVTDPDDGDSGPSQEVIATLKKKHCLAF